MLNQLGYCRLGGEESMTQYWVWHQVWLWISVWPGVLVKHVSQHFPVSAAINRSLFTYILLQGLFWGLICFTQEIVWSSIAGRDLHCCKILRNFCKCIVLCCFKLKSLVIKTLFIHIRKILIKASALDKMKK